MRHRTWILAVFMWGLWTAWAGTVVLAQDATAAASAVPTCALTARQGYANVRSEPSVSAPVVTTIDVGETAVGVAALYDRSGEMWYFTPAGWAAGVAVTASDGCSRLFSVTLFAEARRAHVQIVYDPQPGSGEADSYAQQIAIYGHVPRSPALTLHHVTITATNGATVCADAACGQLTFMLYIPTSGRVTGFFATTPQPGATPEPPSLDHLLYTSPAECLPVGTSCIVAILRTLGDSSATCPPTVFDQLLDVPGDLTPLQALSLLTQDLREAAVQSLDTHLMTPRSLPPLSDSTGCALDMLIPVNDPGQPRFTMIDGGVNGIFNVIRVNPPGA